MTHKEKKEIWLKALRSGEYEQCTGRLSDGTGFCCLGVAALVWDMADTEELSKKGQYGEGPSYVYDSLRGIIPTYPMDQGVLLNDKGVPFDTIADMIEKEWKV